MTVLDLSSDPQEREGGQSSGASALGARLPRIPVWLARTVFVVSLVGLVGFMGWAAFWLCRFTVDDAFITWRYGKSFVASGVWDWNPFVEGSGLPRVEAYTNPLYAFVSIVPAVAGWPVEAFFKAFGLLLLCGGVVVAAVLRDVPRYQRVALVAVMAANPLFVSHFFHGLESGSFVLFIALLYGVLYRRGKLGALGWAAAGLVALSRPEGMGYAFVAVAWAALMNRKDRREVRGALAVMGGLVGYWALRAWWFGHLMPNTYLVKSGSVDSYGIMQRLTYPVVPVLAILAGGAVLCEILWRRADARRDRKAEGAAAVRVPGQGVRPDVHVPLPLQDLTPVVLVALTVAVTLVFYPLSVLHMDVNNRFFWQLTAPVALVLLCRPLKGRRLAGGTRAADGAAPKWAALALALMGLGILYFKELPGIDPSAVVAGGVAAVAVAVVLWGRTVTPLLVVGAAGVMFAVSATPMETMVGGMTYRFHLREAHEELGRIMARDKTIKGLVGMGDAGVFPYALNKDQQAIDLGGLADPYMADPKGIPREVFARNGAAVVVLAGEPDYGKNWFGMASSYTMVDYVKKEKWTYSAGLPFGGSYWLNVFVKPGTGEQFLREVKARRPVAERANTSVEPIGWAYAEAHKWDFPFLVDPVR
ncbi:hypothetical protein GCM10010329_08460 [Streptomyces spiroverticillatus]|uniref:Uncharacterized protein n=1 Tax=Streptomyces finlayi TaxID=67296 RepID=A0A919C879_9ACTN|nr:hypothetical protein [Streptomyces finlayi]GGZ90145.1 hypothetical protein GCM10010329_08460 [Streptomyces spiroverticillatus]GHC81002.1 hypothetical protein GCM10010334_08450 [Streptomyces finlayi]